MTIRDNLLVTIGVRAGEMHCLDYINLPCGVNGEDDIGVFCAMVVDAWLDNISLADEMGFDEWIETNLSKQYGHDETGV